jgi:hypothetical protein
MPIAAADGENSGLGPLGTLAGGALALFEIRQAPKKTGY